jgi:hypothetical protein
MQSWGNRTQKGGGGVKRKLTALVCAVLLTAQLLLPMAQAADTVYFTAVNEVVLELNDATMPFWSNGYLYAAGSIFATRDLGTGYFYNSTKKLAVVYSLQTPSYALFFNLDKDTVDDGDGYGYYPPAILKGGTVFLPVALVSNFFGLTYTSNKVSNGYLIRVRSASSVLSDRVFIDAGTSRLNQRYSEYLAAKEPVTQPEQQTPPDSDSTGQTAGRQTVYLCFRAGEQTEALLAVLDAKNARGTFYMTAEEIASSGDLARRIVATGHRLGLVAEGGGEVPVAQQLRQGNEALWQAAGEKTRLCVLENGTEEETQAAEDAGYCVLSPRIDRSASGLRGSTQAQRLFDQLTARRGAVTVWLADKATASGLQAFITLAAEADDQLAGLRETA